MKKVLLLVFMLIFLVGCGKNENELIMVTEAGFAPYEYYDNGEIVGVDVDIANEIAKEMGKKYVSGKHTNNGTTLLISNGFHKESNDQHRFMTYDEINIIKLKK